ncbi:hypothetical protein N1851_007661 [Merluccius polli]|uniref:Uncharacterized protein n=1 Tax=Merluccius polli TaxID=89951 RepID=A0AA47N3X6_MERPO|nr:hypothetical protein N1851_007661 [Merluccius polli]
MRAEVVIFGPSDTIKSLTNDHGQLLCHSPKILVFFDLVLWFDKQLNLVVRSRSSFFQLRTISKVLVQNTAARLLTVNKKRPHFPCAGRCSLTPMEERLKAKKPH